MQSIFKRKKSHKNKNVPLSHSRKKKKYFKSESHPNSACTNYNFCLNYLNLSARRTSDKVKGYARLCFSFFSVHVVIFCIRVPDGDFTGIKAFLLKNLIPRWDPSKFEFYSFPLPGKQQEIIYSRHEFFSGLFFHDESSSLYKVIKSIIQNY